MTSALAAAVRDPSLWIIAQLPPLLAVGVMFVMTTKPAIGVRVIEILLVVAIGVLVIVPGTRVRTRRGLATEQ